MTQTHTYVLSPSPGELVRYRWMAAAARAEETDDWVAAGAAPGARVADVGCGPGAIAVELAGLVGPAGQVDAVDRDPDTVALAGQVVAAAGAGGGAATAPVRLSVGSATATGLEPGIYDLVMLRHVLAHNGGYEQEVVDHLASLARPGGGVYLVDIDADSTKTRPDVPELAELNDRYRQLHEQLGNDLSVGLRLGELLRAAGLEQVHHRGLYMIQEVPVGLRPPAWAATSAMVRAGVASDDDVARWERTFQRLDQSERRPTMFVSVFAGWGRRPG